MPVDYQRILSARRRLQLRLRLGAAQLYPVTAADLAVARRVARQQWRRAQKLAQSRAKQPAAEPAKQTAEKQTPEKSKKAGVKRHQVKRPAPTKPQQKIRHDMR